MFKIGKYSHSAAQTNALLRYVVHAVGFLNKMAPAAAAALLFMLCHG